MTTHYTPDLDEGPNRVVADAVAAYRAALARQPDMPATTRDNYARGLARFGAWLADESTDYDAAAVLGGSDLRWAATDWRQAALIGTVRKTGGGKFAPGTVRLTLESIADYARRQLGQAAALADVKRPGKEEKAPVALRGRTRRRFDRILLEWPDKRDRAMLGVLRYAGARKSEVVKLDVDDVQMSARKGTIRLYGKGGKVRFVPVHQQLRTYLTEWMEARREIEAADEALFIGTRSRKRMAARTVNDIVAEIGDAADIEDIYPHLLRDTWITELVREQRVDLVTVAELAGHDDVKTTARYAKATAEDLADAVNSIPADHLE